MASSWLVARTSAGTIGVWELDSDERLATYSIQDTDSTPLSPYRRGVPEVRSSQVRALSIDEEHIRAVFTDDAAGDDVAWCWARNSQTKGEVLKWAPDREEGWQGTMRKICLIGGGSLVFASAVPATVVLLHINDMDKIVFFTFRLPSGAMVPLQTWLLPQLAAFAAYRLRAALYAWLRAPKLEFQLVDVCGLPLRMGRFSLKLWHVYVASQFVDAITDIATFKTLSADATSWIAILWGATTLSSITVPFLYMRRRLSLEAAVFFEFSFEDSFQTFAALYQIFSLEQGDVLQETVLFSFLYALLVFFETVG